MSESRKVDVDRDLVERAQGGDTEAFDALVSKHTPRLYSLVFNMTSNHEDTNDLLQDIFARAFRSVKRFQGKSTFYTWIYSISVNMTLSFLKKRNRVSRLSLDDEELAIERSEDYIQSATLDDPSREAERGELHEQLEKALRKLSDEHRTVVTLFDIMGLPHREIAEIMGVSSGTVRSRLYYAHRELQSYLGEFRK